MKARTITIAISAGVHALLAVIAIYYVSTARKQKHQSIAVMTGQKKKEEAKPPPPPPPRPRAKLASVEPAPAPTPPPSHEPPHPHAPSVAAPMTNDTSGGGKGVGGGTAPAVGGGGGDGQKSDAPRKTVAAKPSGEEAPCTEQPTKPAVSSRPTEIEYTQAARADGIEGRLVLKVVIGADGAVQDVIVVSSVDPALDAAAIAAVKTWVFRPAMRCGKPMAGGTYTLAQRFELGD